MCAPFIVLAGILYIYYLIGWPVFAGVAIMVAFIPVGKKISGRMQQLAKQKMMSADGRVRYCNEILQ